MPFEKGNQEAKKADRSRARLFSQELTAALQELGGRDATKMRMVADRLIERAIEGDVPAIREIADRVEGKVPQALTGADGEGPIVLQVIKFARDPSP